MALRKVLYGTFMGCSKSAKAGGVPAKVEESKEEIVDSGISGSDLVVPGDDEEVVDLTKLSEVDQLKLKCSKYEYRINILMNTVKRLKEAKKA